MILYHATTKKRSEKIFEDRCIKHIVDRFYTKELNGNGYTTQNFIYLSNELFMSLYFANSHTLVDKSDSIIVFRVDIDLENLEADYDEIRNEGLSDADMSKYGDDLQCTLQLFKSCRINESICFDMDNVSFVEISKITEGFDSFFCIADNKFSLQSILSNCGHDYTHTIQNYNKSQKELLSEINWIII